MRMIEKRRVANKRQHAEGRERDEAKYTERPMTYLHVMARIEFDEPAIDKINLNNRDFSLSRRQ